MSKILTITNAGLAEIVNHETLGLGPVVINRVVLSSAKLTGDLRTRTSVPDVVKTLTGDDVRGGIAGDNTLNVVAQDTSDSAYTVFTYGVYSATNVLIGIYSQNDPILTKTSVSVGLFAMDLALVNISPASITVGNIEFINPPATTTRAGVAQLATATETQAGSNNTKIVTPSALASLTATTDRRGLIEVATNAETQAGTDSSRAVTPVGLLGAIQQYGIGRDADGGQKTDLDVLTAVGIYGFTSGATGNPSSGTSGSVIVLRRGVNGWCDQIAVGRGTSGVYVRTKLSAGWGSWGLLAYDNPATEAAKGLVILATAAETQAGTDSARAVTPAGLNSRTATDARTGLVELATDSETQAGTDSGRAVTPAGLNSRTATESRTGLVELATSSETSAGIDSSRAVTPAGVKAAITANAPSAATTTIAGLVELATDSETQAGTDSGRAVTPAGLNSRTATESRTGLVELATNSESAAGADSSRAVTPAGVKAAITANAPSGATTTIAGLVELATNSEAAIGTDSVRAVTPAGVKAAISANSPGAATESAAGVVELATLSEAQAGTDGGRAVTPAGLLGAIQQYGIGRDSDGGQKTDLDVLTAVGIYGFTSGATGNPYPGTSGSVIVLRRGTSGWCDQIAVCRGTSGVYVRTKLSEGWGSWGLLAYDNPATEAAKGLVILATAAETQAGADGTRAVTPAGLNSRTATESRTGLVELATNSEAAIGTDSVRAVTPAGVKAAISANSPGAATESAAGVVELATLSEAQAGTDTDRAVTPAGLLGAIQQYGIGSGSDGGQKTDLDALTTVGIYGFSGSATGNPSAGNSGAVIVMRKGVTGWCDQIAVVGGGSAGIYHRGRMSAGWGDWDKVAYEKTATEAIWGFVRLATTAETQAGTDGTRAITPLGLNSRTATETRTGLVELATQGEVNAGTDGARAVTPVTLSSFLSDVGVGAGAIDITSLLGAKGSGFYKGTWTSPPGYPTVAINVANGQGSDGRTAGGFQLGFTAGSNPGLQWRQSLGAGSFGGLRTLWDDENLKIATSSQTIDATSTNTIVTPATLRSVVDRDMTLTVTGSGYNNESVTIKRVGSFVFMDIAFQTLTARTDHHMLTLPAGYRPLWATADRLHRGVAAGEPYVNGVVKVLVDGHVLITVSGDANPVRGNLFWLAEGI